MLLYIESTANKLSTNVADSAHGSFAMCAPIDDAGHQRCDCAGNQ